MSRPTVVVAGARGFVGEALIPLLEERYQVIALGRSIPERNTHSHVEWRKTDLFSLKDAEQGVAGANVGIYLVHSMLPSSRLTQGSFRDLDLITADNFARAAKRAGLEQIIYVGGLIPEGKKLSPHLASRLEVEQALGAHGVPVTALRAGLLIGAKGSSFEILRRLVERLPVMGLPPWMETMTHPIARKDLVAALLYTVLNRNTYGLTFDVGGPEKMTYREMLDAVAKAMHKRPLLIRVPFIPPAASALWVRLVTGAPLALVAPLVKSLSHPMVARDSRLLEAAGIQPEPFAESLAKAIEQTAPDGGNPTAYKQRPSTDQSVRSVQRMVVPPGKTSDWTAQEYMRWLPRVFLPLLTVKVDTARMCRIYPLGLPWALLELEYSKERSADDRALFYIRGGALARTVGRGRLEFRSFFGGAFQIAAVHEYVPRLPWRLYAWTQAKVHLWVMWRFGRHLKRIGAPSVVSTLQMD